MARRVAVVGLLVAAAGSVPPSVSDSTAALVLGASVIGAGAGVLFVAASATTLARVAPAEAGVASGVLSTFHEFGAAFGVAAISSVAAASIAGRTDQGFVTAFVTIGVVAVGFAGLARLVTPGPPVSR